MRLLMALAGLAFAALTAPASAGADGRWLPPVALPSAASVGEVAISRSGWTAAVDGGGVGSTATVSVRPPGGSFAPVMISLPAPGYAGATVAVGETGHVAVALVNAFFGGSGPLRIYTKAPGATEFTLAGTPAPSVPLGIDLQLIVTADNTVAVAYNATASFAVSFTSGPAAGPLPDVAPMSDPTEVVLFTRPRLATGLDGGAVLAYTATVPAGATTHRAVLVVWRRAAGGTFSRVAPVGSGVDEGPATPSGDHPEGQMGDAKVADDGTVELLWSRYRSSGVSTFQEVRGGLLLRGASTLAAANSDRVIAALPGPSATTPSALSVGTVALPGGGAVALYQTTLPDGIDPVIRALHRSSASGAWMSPTVVTSATGTNRRDVVAVLGAPEPGGVQALIARGINTFPFTTSDIVPFVRQVDGSFTAGAALASAGPGETVSFGAAGDGANAILAIRRFAGSTPMPQVAIYDGTPPQILSSAIPASATVGIPAAFAAAGSDAYSSFTTGWSFGDGATVTGANSIHAFGAPGTFPAQVTLTDAVGNSSSSGRAVGVVAAAGGGVSADRTAPVISALKATPKSVRRAKPRSVLSFTLSERATVTVTIRLLRVKGRKVARKCIATSKPVPRAKRCTTTKRISSRKRVLPAGKRRLTAALGSRPKRGTYAAGVSARDAAGNVSKTAQTTITVR